MGRIRIRARKSDHVQRVVIGHIDRVRVRLEPEEGALEGKVAIVRSDAIPAGAKLLEDQSNIPLGSVEIAEIRNANTIRISRITEGDGGATEESRIINQGETPLPGWEIDEETYFDLRGPTGGRMMAIVQMSSALTVRMRGAQETARAWADNTVTTLEGLGVVLGSHRDIVHNHVQIVFADALLTLNTDPDPEDGEKLADMLAHDLLGWSGIPDETGESWIECPADNERRRVAAIDLITMNRWFRDLVVRAHHLISQQLLTAKEKRDEAVKN